MRPMRLVTVALIAGSWAVVAAADNYGQISSRAKAAQAAIEDGSVVPERDLLPLLDMLRTSKDTEDQSHLVDYLVDMGRGDGSSPAAVKRYILDKITPILLSIAADHSAQNFLRGDAILGLRKLGASRAVLQQVAEIAIKDSDSYVQSRGEILQNYITSMPAESKADNVHVTDASKEQEALTFLRKHNLGASADQLKRSAMEQNVEEVSALLAAGVDVHAGAPGERALDSAILGCSREEGETDATRTIVELLLGAGADVKGKDDNANTVMIRAAQYCGAGVVNALVKAGAAVNIVNGSGMTPLQIAVLSNRLDAAEALVAHGARLTAAQAAVVTPSATTARARAIVLKAKKKSATK